MTNANLFATLRAAFPAELDTCAIEVTDGPGGSTTACHSWREVDEQSARVANLLESLQLPPGSRIAVQTEKSVEALLLYLGVLRAGYVYLPLNPAYQADEMRYFIADAEPAVLVGTSQSMSWLGAIAREASVAHCFTLDADGDGTLRHALAAQSPRHDVAACHDDDLAAILYTSGTTGRSKGAMLSHRNLRSNALTLRDYWGWQGTDVLIHALPIFHVHGLFVASHCALLAGARMLWFSRFDAGAVIARLTDATVFMGVPTLYVRMLGATAPCLSREHCRHMRLFISGSAPLLIETFNEFRERTGHTILERYGMSETCMLTSNPWLRADGERRGGTVGLPLPGVEVRVHDERGLACEAGVIGAIQVRGPNVFAGYWRMPEKTREEFTDDGWFRTGDVGRIDADGYVTIVGRSKDLVISGGFNVYPAEVEGFINEMAGVAESAVIGVPHPDFGEAVVAVVVAKPGASVDGERMMGSLKGRIASFKVPKRVFVVDELPRNAMGKVQKQRLREEFSQIFVGGA
ncbi:MAG: malonyl-CoA synthase [Burkholderiales bacterium]|nr:malonyl-CoA synthase [Burkholderiales bacterium]